MMLAVKKIFLISLVFFLAVLIAPNASAADVNFNARIPGSGGQPPPPPPPPPPPVLGCNDPLATNYNPNLPGGGICLYPLAGCTNPVAINYNPFALIDDGSCQLPILGCTDPLSTNYNPNANRDNGSCQYTGEGCTDPTATNYNPLATINNGSCRYQILGCTNPLATNYNPQATINDGSCLVAGCTNPLSTNYDSQATSDDGSCITPGCTDPTAVNYNSQATVDNGLCSYDPEAIPGCLDASAINFNSEATVDNGSCLYLLAGCTDSSALNYNINAKVDNGSCVYTLPIVPLGSISEPAYYFFTNNNGLQLYLANNQLDLLINHELTIIIPNNFAKAVVKLAAVIGGEVWSFTYDTASNQYLLTLDKFNSSGQTEILLLATYADNSGSHKNITVKTQPLGQVFSKLPQDKTRLFGITVSLYDENNKLIRQLQKINADGTYGFMVENGRYRLVVFDNGQKIYDGPFFQVNNHIINRDIGLTWWEELIKLIKALLDNPAVETANRFTAPLALSISFISSMAAIPWWNFINYLNYLFTEPLAWFFRRKKKGWGVVYNSITKKPIDLAVVRLYDKASGQLLKSKVTDKNGRYNFLVSEGRYTLEAIKPNMVFPSQILKGALEDKQFTDLYHGEEIIISKEQKGIITANLPVDPPDLKDSDQEILKRNFWYHIQKNISLIGPAVSLLSFAISPTVLMASFSLTHIILYLLFKRLAAKEKAHQWGVVLDALSGQPLSGSVAKIFAPEYDKMLEAQVTDRFGRYGFLAGNNVYYISANKAGYSEGKTDNIDLTNKKAEEVIGQDLKLQPLTDQTKMSSGQETSTVIENEIETPEETVAEPVEKNEEKTVVPEAISQPVAPIGEKIISEQPQELPVVQSEEKLSSDTPPQPIPEASPLEELAAALTAQAASQANVENKIKSAPISEPREPDSTKTTEELVSQEAQEPPSTETTSPSKDETSLEIGDSSQPTENKFG